MTDKKRFNVSIAGRPYPIIGDRTKEHLDAVVELVNHQYQQLNDLSPSLSLADRSILMAVNAVSDQLIKENKIMALEKEIRQLKAAAPQSSSLKNQIPYQKKD